VRYHHFGEGDYDHSERVIQILLEEAGKSNVSTGLVAVSASGAEAASDDKDVKSPETYIGYRRVENFASPGRVGRDISRVYAAGMPHLNQWSLSGDWTVGGEHAELNAKDGSIVYRFHARDVHLVLGPPPSGQPLRFRVTIDGAAPGENHGADVDAAGNGTINEQRLYQLVRQTGTITDRTFEIRFLDPGVQAFAFTFGEWEADVGRTYVMGDDPEKHRLCQDLPRIFDTIKQYFDDHRDVTGAELYAYAQQSAESAGWLFGGAIAGHIVGEFPHARIPGDKDLYRISPANTQRMRDPDASGQMKYWIIEVHLVDRARTFGGFFERLFQPADIEGGSGHQLYAVTTRT
jgi:hypothetical protein